MELYTRTAYDVSKRITEKYSTSFSSSITLFSKDIQHHIYAIYGLTRIADEIVDTYRGNDSEQLLKTLKNEVYESIARGYSYNPVVMAFSATARTCNIDKTLIEPFFDSMAMDLSSQAYTREIYEKYIHGSAEVVGLMCVKVFVDGDEQAYQALQKSASALGSAYQKINFLRDFAADYRELGRTYFPGVRFDNFDDATKNAIIEDIESDLATARPGLAQLPANSRQAVALSSSYYEKLLKKLQATPADVIKSKRVRIHGFVKLGLFVANKLGVRRHV